MVSLPGVSHSGVIDIVEHALNIGFTGLSIHQCRQGLAQLIDGRLRDVGMGRLCINGCHDAPGQIQVEQAALRLQAAAHCMVAPPAFAQCRVFNAVQYALKVPIIRFAIDQGRQGLAQLPCCIALAAWLCVDGGHDAIG